MADLFKHLAQFAVAALGQDHFVPGIVAGPSLADRHRGCMDTPVARTAAIDRYSLAQPVEFRFGGLTAHLHEVSLLDAGCRLGELVRQVAVIGHQQKAFTQVVQAADRVKPFVHLLEELHDGGAALRIADRGHIAFGLVKHKVAQAFSAADQLSIDPDVVSFGVRFRAQFGDHLAIYLYPALRNHLFGMAAAGHPGLGQNLLQPLESGRKSIARRLRFRFSIFLCV
jgi:hypothetical protein